MLAVVCLLFLIPATLATGYYVFLTLLGQWTTRPLLPTVLARTRFAVLVPAHNEEAVLGATLQTLMNVRYPRHLLHVLVVADNCTDNTAAVAQQYDVECQIRQNPVERGKGYALAFGIPSLLAGNADAVLILDADCRLAPDGLLALDQTLASGAQVVQAAVTMGDPEAGPAGLVMAVGSTIENGVQAGLSQLGGNVRLRGTGMAFRRDVLEQYPWQAFGLTEDAEYSAQLRQAGIRVVFVPTAHLRNTPPTDSAGLDQQRRRWREAMFTRTASLFDRLLMSKPLILAQLTATLLVTLSWAILAPGPVPLVYLAWAAGLGALTIGLYLQAAYRVGASRRALFRLWQTPFVVGRLAWVTLGGLLHRGGNWERTPRHVGVG
ncbi:MAG: glycosyltransferase [Bacteroidales bacterium]|nr:glycosyltransferase [Bacteroidales bacterium]